MKKYLIINLMLFNVILLSGQDIITLTNGTTLKAKISEINTDEIIYKKYNNPDGPTYKVSKESVSKIEYTNGSTEFFSQSSSAIKMVKNELPKFTVQIDPLGFLQFGPVVGFELRAGQNSYIDAHFRWLYAGFLYHAISSDFFNYEYEADILSRGVGLGYKYMLPSRSNHRMYVGALAEILTMDQINNPGDYDEEDCHSKGIVICGDWGYRWHFSKMSLSVGANFGFQYTYLSEYSDEDYDYEGIKTSDEEGTLRPILLAKVTLGF